MNNKLKLIIEGLHSTTKAKLLYYAVFGKFYSDESYLRHVFKLHKGYDLNLDNPQTFSEKLQWLKLYNRNPDYVKMVDKIEAKKYVASIIGEEYVVPTLATYNSVDEIDFEKLPNRFVLKTNQAGGSVGVVVCQDKSTFDQEAAKSNLLAAMRRDHSKLGREWIYKKIKPQILAEQYLDPSPETDLRDYKFSCFDGNVTDVMVCMERNSGETKFYFFDKDWTLLPLNIRGKNAPAGFTVPKPPCMDLMFELASKLSKGIPYARVDLYAVNNKPYFGEITFFPDSGFDSNLLPETEKIHGSLIKLPQKYE